MDEENGRQGREKGFWAMSSPIAVLDTSIYISHWQANQYEDKIDFARNRYLIRQCSVVLHELRRGARTKNGIRLVENLIRTSPEILNPTDTDWWKAAQILQPLLKKKRASKPNLQNLQNDCLIALCARRVGGLVITADKKDFPLLEKSLPCPVLYW